MSTSRTYLDYAEEILQTIEKIQEFVQGMDYSQFAKDDKTSFAVIRGLEIIGEAVKQLPRDVRDQQPQIPWQSIAGMRDKLIHAYFGVSLRVVWKTVQSELEPLQIAITEIIAKSTIE